MMGEDTIALDGGYPLTGERCCGKLNLILGRSENNVPTGRDIVREGRAIPLQDSKIRKE